MRTGATITILFTDIVSSTELSSRLGDRRWDAERRTHFTALREVLAAHSGIEVKNTGDGLMSAFTSAADAVDCAVEMQGRVGREASLGSPITMRIGLSTGEATNEGGDWFGPPVVEAARLCALAPPAGSWATSIVRTLVGSAGTATFQAVGPTELKGFDQPVDVVSIHAGLPSDRSFWVAVDDHQQVSDRLRRTARLLGGVAVGTGVAIVDGRGDGSHGGRPDLRHRLRIRIRAGAARPDSRCVGPRCGDRPEPGHVQRVPTSSI